MYPVVFVQLNVLLAFVNSDAVAFEPFVPAVNVKVDGSVMFTDVIFAVCSAFVLFMEILNVVCIVSLVL